jgi:hypothetical protein
VRRNVGHSLGWRGRNGVRLASAFHPFLPLAAYDRIRPIAVISIIGKLRRRWVVRGQSSEVSKHKKKVRELVLKSGTFQHIQEVDGFVYVFNEISDLTGFCVPLLRKAGDVFIVDYEYGIAVPMENPDRTVGLIQSLTARSVILPRTIDPAHTSDTFTYGDCLSQWLTDDMADMMRRFTLRRDQALALINDSEDRYLNALKRVYREKFTNWIIHPLTKLAPRA